MSAIKTDAVVDAGSGPSAAEVLADTRADVDRVLELIPDNRLEARRVITREWGFQPSAGELQSICRLAHDALAQKGLSRELLRSTLAVRLQIDRELDGLLDRDELDAGTARRFQAHVDDLQRTRDAFDVQLRAAAQTLPPNERAFLQNNGKTLAPARDLLITARALAPILERLAQVVDEPSLGRVVPELPELERARLAPALKLTGDESTGRPTPECVNALALCAGIFEDIAAWGVDEDPGRRQQRLQRLRNYATACEVVAARLRGRLEADQLADVDTNLDHLRRSRSSLVAAFRRLAALLNEIRPASVGRSSLLSDDDGLHQLLARSAQQDARADTTRANMLAEKERDLQSLKDAAAGVAVLAPPKKYDLNREKMRIRILSGIIGVLVVVCAIVWGLQLKDRKSPARPPVDDISSTVALKDTLIVGPMIFATVDRRSWNDLTDSQKLAAIDEMGANAASKGYETVYVVDDARSELGLWSEAGGAELKRPERSSR